MTEWLTGSPWDVEAVEVSPDGRLLAVVHNEDGASVLEVVDAKKGKVRRQVASATGEIGGIDRPPSGRDWGFNRALDFKKTCLCITVQRAKFSDTLDAGVGGEKEPDRINL